MKEIKLTQNKVAIVDDEDFEYLSQFKWTYDRFRSEDEGYAVRRIKDPITKKRIKIRMHALINNTPKGLQTDHINGNPLDNRKCNLRTCNNQKNSYNQRKPKNNTSGYKGVSWNKNIKRYVAYFSLNGKRAHLGYFNSKEDAAIVYNKAVIENYGNFANINKI